MTKNEKITGLEPYEIRIEEELYDAEEAAGILKSSKKVVERELREGKLTGYKRLGKWFVLKSDLIAYLRTSQIE